MITFFLGICFAFPSSEEESGDSYAVRKDEIPDAVDDISLDLTAPRERREADPLADPRKHHKNHRDHHDEYYPKNHGHKYH